MQVKKGSHTTFWGVGKAIVFWSGFGVIIAGIGAFNAGNGAGVFALILGLVIMGAGLSIKNKNRVEY